jgi:hypothetical protein
MATGSPTAPQRADLAELEPAQLEALYSTLDILREEFAGLLDYPAFTTLRTGLDRALVRLYAGICVASEHQEPTFAQALARAGIHEPFWEERSAGYPLAIAETELRALWGDR